MSSLRDLSQHAAPMATGLLAVWPDLLPAGGHTYPFFVVLLHKDYYALMADADAHITLTGIRYEIDSAEPFYKKEKEYYAPVIPFEDGVVQGQMEKFRAGTTR